ncbi:pentapeptide repeat-containing protein [Candidatus Dependentiae bacterium]
MKKRILFISLSCLLINFSVSFLKPMEKKSKKTKKRTAQQANLSNQENQRKRHKSNKTNQPKIFYYQDFTKKLSNLYELLFSLKQKMDPKKNYSENKCFSDICINLKIAINKSKNPQSSHNQNFLDTTKLLVTRIINTVNKLPQNLHIKFNKLLKEIIEEAQNVKHEIELNKPCSKTHKQKTEKQPGKIKRIVNSFVNYFKSNKKTKKQINEDDFDSSDDECEMDSENLFPEFANSNVQQNTPKELNKNNIQKLIKRLNRFSKKLKQLVKQKNEPLFNHIYDNQKLLDEEIKNIKTLQQRSNSIDSFNRKFDSLSNAFDKHQINQALQGLQNSRADNALLNKVFAKKNKILNWLKRDFTSNVEFSEDSDSEEVIVPTEDDLREEKFRGILQKQENLDKAKNGEKNLEGIDLSGLVLKDINLENSNLKNANLTDTKLIGANLKGADLTDAKMQNVDLTNVDLTKANLTRVDLSGLNLKGIIAKSANFDDTNLSYCDLSGADLSGGTFTRTNLQGAILNRTNLNNTKFVSVNLSESVLDKTKVEGIQITEKTNFAGSNLKNLHFCKNAKLDDVVFYDPATGISVLESVIFEDCDLKNINLRSSKCSKVQFIKTSLENISFDDSNLEYLVFMDQGCIGKNLSFYKASIENSCFIGKVLDNWQIRQMSCSKRTSGISIPVKMSECHFRAYTFMYQDWKGKLESLIFFTRGPQDLLFNELLTPLVSHGLTNVVGAEEPLDVFNINSYLEDANFNYAKLSTVVFTNICFQGEPNFKYVSTAKDSIFENVYLGEYFKPMPYWKLVDPNSQAGRLIKRGAIFNSIGEKKPSLVEIIKGILTTAQGAAFVAQAIL